MCGGGNACWRLCAFSCRWGKGGGLGRVGRKVEEEEGRVEGGWGTGEGQEGAGGRRGII